MSLTPQMLDQLAAAQDVAGDAAWPEGAEASAEAAAADWGPDYVSEGGTTAADMDRAAEIVRHLYALVVEVGEARVARRAWGTP